MKHALLALAALCLFAGTAAAQSTAGQDGKPIYSASGTWQCTKARFPNGATSGKVLITGVNTVCASGSCASAGGNADLYVYGTTQSGAAPGYRAGGACAPHAAGNEESCSIGTVSGGDWYYWACVDNVASYNQIQLRAEFNLGNASGSTGAATSGSTWWIDYWKNNLFLGVAYHRFGCFTNNLMIVDDREYDGFTDTDYCRYGQGLNDPATRGGESSYMISTQYTGWTWQSVKNRFESCGASTNSYYVTPSYQRRSNSCSYNLLKNCNSDCWIKKFSQCEAGTAVSILSPCW